MRSALMTILLPLAALALPASAGWRPGPRPPPPRPQMRAPAPPPRQFAPPPRPAAPMYQPQRQAPPQFAPPGFQQAARPPQAPPCRDCAIQRARQMTGNGRVLGADPVENGYRVRVLKNGEVTTVYVPQ